LFDFVGESVPFVSKALKYTFYHHVRSFADCPVRKAGILDPFKVIGTEVPETVMILFPKASIKLLDNFDICHQPYTSLKSVMKNLEFPKL
jgi:hypothetical protein